LIASRLLARMQMLDAPAPMNYEAPRQRQTSTQSASPDTPAHGLSPREVELLLLLSRGYTYQEAANLMAVELGTVQTYVKRIYTKLAVNSRTQAIFEARALGISL
jgi:DNA-binding NarL/FixJ family response regulator